MSRVERVVFATSGGLNEEKPALPALIKWLQIKKTRGTKKRVGRR